MRGATGLWRGRGVVGRRNASETTDCWRRRLDQRSGRNLLVLRREGAELTHRLPPHHRAIQWHVVAKSVSHRVPSTRSRLAARPSVLQRRIVARATRRDKLVNAEDRKQRGELQQRHQQVDAEAARVDDASEAGARLCERRGAALDAYLHAGRD